MVRKVHGTNRPWYEKSTNGTKRLWYEKSMVRKVWLPFPPHQTSASTLPGENRTNEICTEMNNKRQQTGD